MSIFKMIAPKTCLGFLAVFSVLVVHGHSHHHHHGRDQEPLSWSNAPSNTPSAEGWLKKYGPQIDQTFSGPLSFSHLPYKKCLEDTSVEFDIALLGMPFDTAVSYRPGARFGPYAIRSGSRRQRESRGYTLSWKSNPYARGLEILDCGDVSGTMAIRCE